MEVEHVQHRLLGADETHGVHRVAHHVCDRRSAARVECAPANVALHVDHVDDAARRADQAKVAACTHARRGADRAVLLGAERDRVVVHMLVAHRPRVRKPIACVRRKHIVPVARARRAVRQRRHGRCLQRRRIYLELGRLARDGALAQLKRPTVAHHRQAPHAAVARRRQHVAPVLAIVADQVGGQSVPAA